MVQIPVYIIPVTIIVTLLAKGAFDFAEDVARSKWMSLFAGTVTIAVLLFLIHPYLFKITPPALLAIAPIAYTFHKSLRMILKGARMKRPKVSILNWDERTVTLLVEKCREFQGVDEGFFYVTGGSVRRRRFVVSNYEFRRVPEYRVRWLDEDRLLITIDCPRRFVSGFMEGRRGFVVARCVRVRVDGRKVYLCPPVGSVRLFVDRSLRVEIPEGLATLSVGACQDKLVMVLNAALRDCKAKVSIVRKNALTGDVMEEKVFETKKSGAYRIVWKPVVVSKPIVFTDCDLPHRVFGKVASDLTSEVNTMTIVLSLERKGKVAYRCSSLVVEKGKGKSFWRFAVQD